MKAADRLGSVSEYYFSRKLREVAEMNAAGADVINLGIGSPDMPPSDETIKTLAEAAADPANHGYQPYNGIPELRAGMAEWYDRWYGVKLDGRSEILPLIGSKEGILHITLAFVNPGDKVLVPDPGYPTYSSLSRLLGAEVETYDLLEGSGWRPDFDELERRDLSRVKLLWTNYPNMPTGAKADLGLYEELVSFARRHDIIVVNDNPYSLILNREPISIMQIEGAKDCCIELNSMSKSHNMAGWRVGMLISNAQYVSWVLKVKSNIDSGMFKGVQLAAAAALRNSDEWHEAMNYDYYARKRVTALEIMQALGCSVDENQAGMFLWGRIPDEIAEVETLTERVLREARVFITPGFIFGKNGRRYVRISLTSKQEKLDEALRRIRENIN